MGQIIDGKKIAHSIVFQLKKKILKLEHKPGLAILLIGDDPASHIYVKLKKKAAEECGIGIHVYLLDTEITEKQLLEVIRFLNVDSGVHGIIVQLPLPKKFNTDTIISAIDPRKDVDGFHPKNLELLETGTPYVVSGLALGIMRLIEVTKMPLKGKQAVIVSKSEVFSKPLAYILKQHGLSIIHVTPKTKNISEKVSQADILIVAVGKPNFIKKLWIKEGAIVIDVGITRRKNGEVVGDVSPHARERNIFLTPVPGGVGPMTVAMLLYNTYLLATKT